MISIDDVDCSGVGTHSSVNVAACSILCFSVSFTPFRHLTTFEVRKGFSKAVLSERVMLQSIKPNNFTGKGQREHRWEALNTTQINVERKLGLSKSKTRRQSVENKTKSGLYCSLPQQMQGCRTHVSAPYTWERWWTKWRGWARPPGQPCLYGCFGFRPNSPPYTMICRWAWIRSSAAGSWWHNFTPNAQRETTGSISPPPLRPSKRRK